MDFERIISLSNKKVEKTEVGFERYLIKDIEWNLPLVLLFGARGAGKTTMFLQHMKSNYGSSDKALYANLDDFFFEENRLVLFAEAFYKKGGEALYLDEVHRYPNWSRDLKMLYDNYPELKIYATGSSILDLTKGEADLSRRAAQYHMAGLSFREFLALKHSIHFKPISLLDIVENHEEIAREMVENFDPLPLFNQYLVHGYFPFFKESIQQYPARVVQTINLVLEHDMPAFESLDYQTVRNLRKLLYILAQSVPFTPNVASLSSRMGTSRNTILKMFDLLHRAEMIDVLYTETKSLSWMTKPEKIYLGNPNLSFALSEIKPEKGQIRETFFLNQLSVKHLVSMPKYGDFFVNETYVFEIGGPSKTIEQIKGLPSSYLAIDELKVGSGKRIPLWLFGMMY